MLTAPQKISIMEAQEVNPFRYRSCAESRTLSLQFIRLGREGETNDISDWHYQSPSPHLRRKTRRTVRDGLGLVEIGELTLDVEVH